MWFEPLLISANYFSSHTYAEQLHKIFIRTLLVIFCQLLEFFGQVMYPANLSSAANILWNLLELYGRDPEEIFKRAGLDSALIRKPGSRYSEKRLENAWEMAADVISDPCFGLKAGGVWHPSYFGALGYAMLTSDTLKRAFERMERFQAVVTGRKVVKVSEDSGGFHVELLYGRAEKRLFARIDAMFSVLLAICRLNLHRDIFPDCVQVQHDRPGCAGAYHELFGPDVRFGSRRNVFTLSHDLAREPLKGADRQLSLMHDEVMSTYIRSLEKHDFLPKLKRAIARRLPSGGVKDTEIAAALNLSPRQMYRKLKALGTTFHAVLSDVRYEIAKENFSSSNYSVTEIAFLLGFAEASSFSRAFKRWSGMSPVQYRQKYVKIS